MRASHVDVIVGWKNPRPNVCTQRDCVMQLANSVQSQVKHFYGRNSFGALFFPSEAGNSKLAYEMANERLYNCEHHISNVCCVPFAHISQIGRWRAERVATVGTITVSMRKSTQRHCKSWKKCRIKHSSAHGDSGSTDVMSHWVPIVTHKSRQPLIKKSHTKVHIFARTRSVTITICFCLLLAGDYRWNKWTAK